MSKLVRPEPGLAELRRARVGEADQRLTALLEDALRATGTTSLGVSVVAVGGYGRAELSTVSDLDVLLVYDHRCPQVEQVAERLWYPLWDAGVRLDHSMRTIEETQQAAERDLRTALSVLDARHVAGDQALTVRLRSTLLADWRRRGPHRLRDLESQARERATAAGELSSLLEPDLRDSSGGLRDGIVLRAVAATWLVDVPQASLARARADLLDVRDALHELVNRRHGDRLLTELQPEVAQRLGLPGRHELLRHVYAAARTVGHLGNLVWRRVGHALATRVRRRPSTAGPGPTLTGLARGVASTDGEVVLARNVRPERDPGIVLRAAAAAASGGLPLSPYACAELARRSVAPRTPWSEQQRRNLVTLLGSGPALVPTWEALDQAGLLDVVLPEWKLVRDHPQDSPVHRYTVDRHLLHTCVQASALVRRTARPDLLLVAALLHDLGKPWPGDHSVVGAEYVEPILTRWGFADRDVATVVRLVRHHLMLVETATRRDLSDPVTVAAVVEVVEDTDMLDLLAALTEADARATGPSAWTTWRAGLVSQLVDLARGQLEQRTAPSEGELEKWQRDLVRQVSHRRRLEVVVDDAWGSKRVTVVSPVPSEELAATAGVLAGAGLSIHGAWVERIQEYRQEHEVGVTVWNVAGEPPSARVLRERIGAALAGRTDVAATVSARDAAYDNGGRLASALSVPEPDVRVVSTASDTATVLEVRARDRPGLFYRISEALGRCGCRVRSAHVSTWGVDAVDVFYLTTSAGDVLSTAWAEEAAHAVRTALAA